MSPQLGRGFRPQLLELEPRDVPAWFGVTAPDPAAGTPGDTDATHGGQLAFAAEYTPGADGKVSVWADSALAAVGKALTGTLSATFAGTTTDYTFGPGAVGTSAAEQLPFLVTVSGDSVGIAFEDMAGQAGCDYDYNDRSFGGVTATGDGSGGSGIPTGDGSGSAVTPSSGVVEVARLDDQVWWAAQDPGAYATVTSVVSLVEIDGKAAYKWLYKVHNDTVDWIDPDYNPYDPPTGLAGVSVAYNNTSALTVGSAGNDQGWDSYDHTIGIGRGGFWYDHDLGDTGGFVYRGGTGEFWYYTEPAPATLGTGEFFSGGLAGGGGGTALVPGPPPNFRLQSVTFSGTSEFEIAADPGDPAHPAPPHWYDGDTNGVIDIAGDRSLPVGYVRNKRVEIAAKWRADTSLGMADGSYQVRADGPGVYDLDWSPATLSGGYLTLTATPLAKDLADYVDYIAAFDLKWDIRVTPTAVVAGGRSSNPVYVTLATPAIAAPIYRTVVHISTVAAAGENERDKVIAKTWGVFASRVVNMAPPALIAGVGGVGAVLGARQLYYYKDWNTIGITTDLLLQTRDGECNGWVGLFLDTLAVHIGYQANNKMRIKANGTGEMLVIKNWTQVIQSPNHAGRETWNKIVYPYWNYYVIDRNAGIQAPWKKIGGQWQYAWKRVIKNNKVQNQVDLEDSPGLPGQGTENPKSIFDLHVVAVVDGKIYDSSYGNGPYADVTAWADASLYGYCYDDKIRSIYAMRAAVKTNGKHEIEVKPLSYTGN